MNQAGGEVDVGSVGLISFLLNVSLLLIVILILKYIVNSRRRRNGRKKSALEDREPKESAVATIFTGSDAKVSEKTYSAQKRAGVDIISTPLVNSEPKHKMVNYQYRRRDYLMTSNERDFYRELFGAVGRRYLIFPQIHLDALLDGRIHRQYHEAAIKAIRTFSVDYVLCDPELRIVCAIELDDSTHSQESRRIRDEAVNYVFDRANLPLIRIPLASNANGHQLADLIFEHIDRDRG